MTLVLTKSAMRAIFPKAPDVILQAFVDKQSALTLAGIDQSRTRLAYFFANIEHECDGFTIPGLVENINYTARRMAEVWPSRYPNAAAVQRRYGTAKGWQIKAFNDIYGGRMGNRTGTDDGSRYIGRGGPQVTGRDGYAEIGKRIGIDLVANPERASEFGLQPKICAAFWSWKGLNASADHGDFLTCVKRWNGGTNGMADRRVRMRGNDPIIKKLQAVSDVSPKLLVLKTV